MTIPGLLPITPPAPPQRVYVSFSADVNPTTAAALLAVAAQLANQRVQEVYLLLSTPGGSVMDGINVYNVLRGLPFKLITHNVGNVDSIGNVIFLAGAERYACANATFMFHGVAAGLPPNQTHLELKAIRERLDSVKNDNRRIATIIAERATFRNRQEVDKLFLEARTKDAVYAKERGIVHDIRDVHVPPGTPVQQLIFQR
jgi:ATP-dependent Clp protease, protease subunit